MESVDVVGGWGRLGRRGRGAVEDTWGQAWSRSSRRYLGGGVVAEQSKVPGGGWVGRRCLADFARALSVRAWARACGWGAGGDEAPAHFGGSSVARSLTLASANSISSGMKRRSSVMAEFSKLAPSHSA